MKKDDGVAAFPRPGPYGATVPHEAVAQTGMTLRDYFAAKAMQGMMQRDSFDPGQASPTQRARLAYLEADAMLKERDK